MKLKLLLIIPMLLISTFAEEYTIEDILTKVKDCSDDIAIAEIEYAIGKRNAEMTRSEALPNISFSTGVGYAGLANTLLYPLPSSDTLITHLHGATINWSLDVNQPIMTFGGALNALKISKISDTLFNSTKDLAKEIFYLTVVATFDSTFSAQNELKIAERSLKFAERNLEKTRISLELGNAIPRDTLTAVSKVYQEKSVYIRALSNYEVQLKRLAELTEITMDPQNTKLAYSGNGWLSALEKSTSANSAAIKIKENEVAMRKLRIAYQRSKLLPSIYLNAGLNNSFMIPNQDRAEKDIKDAGGELFPGFKLSNADISDYANPDYVNYNIGAQLVWNIFDGKRSISTYKMIMLEHEKSERELKILREKTNNDEKVVYKGYEAICKALEAAEVGYQAAQLAYASVSEDMNDGFVDYLTFLEVEKGLDQAEKAVATLQMQKLLLVSQYRFTTGKSLVKDVK